MANRLVKYLIVISVGIAAIIIFLLYHYIFAIPTSVRSEIEKIECDGTLIGITDERPCFSKIEVQQQKAIVSLTVNKCCADKDFFKFISKGDKIQKQKGNSSLVVTKQGETVSKVFEYPFCFQ